MMTILAWIAGIAGVLVAVVAALFAYVTLAVNADANRQDRVDAAPPIGRDPAAFMRAVHGAASEPPCAGNQVTLFQNGDEIFPALTEAIRGARETVHFCSYVYWAGDIPDQFATLLAETARRGVRVRLLVDSEGAEQMRKELVDRMREAGVVVGTFRQARWFSWMRYNHRCHRRILVVDGHLGFTGAVGIADEWGGHAQDADHWRDTHARITGPAVASLQAAFADVWNQCTDDLLLNARDYPEIEHAGEMQVCIVVSTPSSGTSAAQRTMACCIAGASTSLHITNAYFVPTPAFVHNLCVASRRGVEVMILVPGTHIDVSVVRYASRHVWPKLLEAGVRIFEFQPTMVHCKTLVADRQVSLVGSINFDPRSFALNSECGVLVSDAGLAAEMERVYAADLDRSKEVTLASLGERSRFDRVRDAAAYWIRAQL